MRGLGRGWEWRWTGVCWLWWTLTARTDCLACLRLDWDVRETDHGHSVMVELLRASARDLVRVGYWVPGWAGLGWAGWLAGSWVGGGLDKGVYFLTLLAWLCGGGCGEQCVVVWGFCAHWGGDWGGRCGGGSRSSEKNLACLRPGAAGRYRFWPISDELRPPALDYNVQ